MIRPPIIVVLGHVDHGKTTLLDHIRTKYIERARPQVPREAGGITQSIGAYEIERKGEKFTFIDTPGHEAFSVMRACGAEVADIAILLVAANDGVKPQTKEAFQCIQNARIPYVVAINKTDLPEANVEKTKSDLALMGVYLEGQGGDISWQGISAKKGDGVEELLDLLSLAAQVEDLQWSLEAPAEGVVITSGRDSRRGIFVGVVLKNGILRQGDLFATARTMGNVRALENFLGASVASLEPSAPALILGWSDVPKVGEIFFAGKDSGLLQARAKEAEKKIHEHEITTTASGDAFHVFLKADETGSLEALKGVFSNIAKSEGNLHVAGADVGQITEADVKRIPRGNSLIVGFRVKIDKAAENLAQAGHIGVYISDIIYKLDEEVRNHLRKMFRKPSGILEVLAVFGERKGSEHLVGGRVAQGAIKNQSAFEVRTKTGEALGEGKIKNLQSKRQDVPEVKEGAECGMLVECDVLIEAGHQLYFFV